MTFDIHMSAYALSPHYHDHNVFDNGPVMTGLKKVMRFFAETPADYTFALAEFAEFKNFVDVNLFSEASLRNVFSKDSWQLHGAQWPHL